VKYDKKLLLLELRSVECSGIGNYRGYRIFGGISHTSKVLVTFLEAVAGSGNCWGITMAGGPI